MMNKKQISKQLKSKKASEKMRVVRGYAIISKGDTPKNIGKERKVFSDVFYIAPNILFQKSP